MTSFHSVLSPASLLPGIGCAEDTGPKGGGLRGPCGHFVATGIEFRRQDP